MIKQFHSWVYYPREMKTYQQDDLGVTSHGSSNYNVSKVETTQKPIN